MKKDLIKLANDLDKIGYAKLANRVSSLLVKSAELYDSTHGYNWGNKDNFSMVRDSSITQDFYEIKRYKGTQEHLDSYIKRENISDWQKDKVINAITNDSRWSEKRESPDQTEQPDVTVEDFCKLLIADKDSNYPYKMSDEIFNLGKENLSSPILALKGKLSPEELEIIKS